MTARVSSCARGPWRNGINARGNSVSVSHHSQFPPLFLLSSSYTHDSIHCLDYILIFKTVVGEPPIGRRVLLEADAFGPVIKLDFHFGFCSLMAGLFL